LKIIPVIDILDGLTVHAIRGERRKYKPVTSVLCMSNDPVEFALTFRRLGFSQLYIADLDAILKRKPNVAAVKRIAQAGMRLMVDAGVTDLARAKELLDNRVSEVIIGTETLSSTLVVEEAVRIFGSDKIMISLDMCRQRLLGKLNLAKSMDPIAVLRAFQDMNVKKAIVLDLARVGSKEGIDETLLDKILKNFNLEIYVGGGVRDSADLHRLSSLGVSGVLVATALHNGSIHVDEVKPYQ
jgi:phosphoribosylformimino-5-aminoimidazole carboxamide ribotide isomerase